MMRKPMFALVTILLGSPVVALAAPTASVTTSPLANAPALALPALLLLAVVLGAVTVYRLQRRGRTRAAVAAIAATFITLAGITYASSSAVIIEGIGCNATTTNPFDPTYPPYLRNYCTNVIKIVDITLLCDNFNGTSPDPQTGETAPVCEEGMLVQPHTSCHLPGCL